MQKPERSKINGYWVTETADGWEVGNSDRRLAGPFESKQEAVDAATKLPSKG
ncbi:DUF2188 domain-containing protein [Pseudomonas sp. DTU_2021_1001937_2_SI_NGA_ILE_001]|uniref:DUF2188 domain-containing protein n=1 Tax=Pseudomonas sp. DTU_2021_1001937_2_SI_NGA_ILE_001 TaxID=3077589 RepID=UPI00397A49C8